MENTKQKVVTAAKYSGSSIGIAVAITQIVVFVFPQVEPIKESIAALVTFVTNLLLAGSGIISNEK